MFSVFVGFVTVENVRVLCAADGKCLRGLPAALALSGKSGRASRKNMQRFFGNTAGLFPVLLFLSSERAGASFPGLQPGERCGAGK